MTHTQLIERLRKAEGPDRELDVRINMALPGNTIIADASDEQIAVLIEVFNVDHEDGSQTTNTMADQFGIPHYTASIDAALSLVERVLPDHRWGVGAVGITSGVHPDGKPAYVEGFRAHVTERSPLRPMPVTGVAKTAPLAILIAALTALQARSKE